MAAVPPEGNSRGSAGASGSGRSAELEMAHRLLAGYPSLPTTVAGASFLRGAREAVACGPRGALVAGRAPGPDVVGWVIEYWATP